MIEVDPKQIAVPPDVLENWQHLVNLLVQNCLDPIGLDHAVSRTPYRSVYL